MKHFKCDHIIMLKTNVTSMRIVHEHRPRNEILIKDSKQ